MKFTIQLAVIKNKSFEVKVPFFFTRDKSIHLGGDVDSVILESDQLSMDSLIEIKNGVVKGNINIDDETVLLNALSKFIPQPEKLPEAEQNERVPVTLEDQKQIKMEVIIEEAKNNVSKPAGELIELIGSDKIEDGILSKGITDYTLLDEMLKAESEKTGKAKPRVSVINAIKARISAIEEVGIEITGDGLEDIVETVHEKVRLTETKGDGEKTFTFEKIEE